MTVPHLWKRRLGPRFYARAAPVVAKELLGCALICGQRAGIIVETHARFGPTPRAQVMFGPAGIAYVYLCYGMHHMFNIVTDSPGQAGAVLVRALAPPALFAARAQIISLGDIACGPRVGVDYAGHRAHRRLRYWLRRSPSVSRPGAARGNA
jgi:DNA-3-methyladenine glycosylase